MLTAMPGFQTNVARVFLLIGMCAWIAGSVASSIHHVVVQHAVCAQHGEVVELAHGEAVEFDDDVVASELPELRAAPATPVHDHGCSFDVGSLDGTEVTPAEMTSLRLLVWPETAPLPACQPPRGPPLGYAPKTSPPHTS